MWGLKEVASTDFPQAVSAEECFGACSFMENQRLSTIYASAVISQPAPSNSHVFCTGARLWSQKRSRKPSVKVSRANRDYDGRRDLQPRLKAMDATSVHTCTCNFCDIILLCLIISIVPELTNHLADCRTDPTDGQANSGFAHPSAGGIQRNE